MLTFSFIFNLQGLSRRLILKTKILIIKKLMFFCNLKSLSENSSIFFSNNFKKIKKTSVLKSPFKFKKDWDHFGVVCFRSRLQVNFALTKLNSIQKNLSWKFINFLNMLVAKFSSSDSTNFQISKKIFWI